MISRVLAAIALWAGPGSVAVSIGLLILNARYFDHGPGVPSAGREEAWTALWLAVLLLVSGHALSLVANLGWLIVRLRRRTTIGAIAWIRLGYHALVPVPLLLYVFGR